MSEFMPEWASKNPDGEGVIVDIEKLLFSITLHELCIVGILNNVDSEGHKNSREIMIEIWKAEILNLRKCKYMDVVRCNYYLHFNRRDDTRASFGKRWSAAHQTTKFLFTVNLEDAYPVSIETDPLILASKGDVQK